MNDRPFLQVNLKCGNTLVNGYADDTEEFVAILDLMNEKLGQIASLDAAALAAANVAHGTTSAQAPPAQTQTQPAAPGPGPSCEHGAKVYKTGVSKRTNKEWKAWDCPAGICDRQFTR